MVDMSVQKASYQTEGLTMFIDSLYYHMQYRILDPQVFELALYAWNCSNTDGAVRII